jgi:hypothetical protein
MRKTILTATITGLVLVLASGSSAFATPLGSARSAIQSLDGLTEPVAFRGGFVRRGNINVLHQRAPSPRLLGRVLVDIFGGRTSPVFC